ncbi:MAG: PspC domain-containing protein [Planctomycetota bacterium]|jgi:phage shock protein C
MKKLYLSDTDSKIFGVCGGIGESYNIDPTVVRLVTVFLCFATAIFPLAITYLVSKLIIPEKPMGQSNTQSDS